MDQPGVLPPDLLELTRRGLTKTSAPATPPSTSSMTPSSNGSFRPSVDEHRPSIISRLRRLEIATLPNPQTCAAAEAIRATRRKRLGADYQEIVYPPGSYDGCHTMAECIRRARHLRMEREKRESRTNTEPFSARE